jgi:acyl dehydratase
MTVALKDRWFDDFAVGEQFEFGAYVVSEDEIIDFARRYDPQPFHLDHDAAKASHFGGLVASGWMTSAVLMRLLCDHFIPRQSSMGSPGVDEVRWLKPLRPGDTVRARVEVDRDAGVAEQARPGCDPLPAPTAEPARRGGDVDARHGHVQEAADRFMSDIGDDATLARRIAAYLSAETGRSVTVDGVRRFPVGFSWLTYGVAVRGLDGPAEQDLILRLGPDDGLFAPYSALPQVLAMQALQGTAVPVPQAWWHSDDPALLGAPFLFCEKAAGAAVVPWVSPTEPPLPDDYRRALGTQFIDALAALHRVPWSGRPVAQLTPGITTHNAAQLTVDHLAAQITAGRCVPTRWPSGACAGCVTTPRWHRTWPSCTATTAPATSWSKAVSSPPSSTGSWCTWATRTRTWAGPACRCTRAAAPTSAAWPNPSGSTGAMASRWASRSTWARCTTTRCSTS